MRKAGLGILLIVVVGLIIGFMIFGRTPATDEPTLHDLKWEGVSPAIREDVCRGLNESTNPQAQKTAREAGCQKT